MTAYEVRISDWSSDVCSSYLSGFPYRPATGPPRRSHGPAFPDSRTSGLILGLGGTLALVGLYRTGVVRGLDHSLAFACPGAFRHRLRLGRLGGFLFGRFAEIGRALCGERGVSYVLI